MTLLGVEALAARSGAMHTFFSVLEAVFKPYRKVKRHLREGALVKYGRDARGRVRMKDDRRDRHRARRPRLPDDVEAGGPAARVVGEEAVHLMGNDDNVPAVDEDDVEVNAGEENEEHTFAWRRADSEVKTSWTADEVKANLEQLITGGSKLVENTEAYSDEWEEKLLELRMDVEVMATRLRIMNPENDKSVEDYINDFVMECLLHSVSEFDLVQRAELLVPADWLMTIDEIPGSMYRMAAFGEFDRATSATGKRVTKSTAADGTPIATSDSSQRSMTAQGSMYAPPSFTGTKLAARVRLLGFVAVLIIQIFGPPLIFGSVMPEPLAVGVEYSSNVYVWSNVDKDYMTHLKTEWETLHTTKIMGILFLLAFLLNASYVVYNDYKAFDKIYAIFDYLNRSTPNFDLKGNYFLLLGTFVNCWVVGWCSIDAFFVIGSAMTPADLLLDALGLIFLYNLDDVGGDFGFVDDDDWPGVQLGWIYSEMVDMNNGMGYQLQNEDERSKAESMVKKKDETMKKFAQWTYVITIMVTGCLLVILPIMACFVPFHAVIPGAGEEEGAARL